MLLLLSPVLLHCPLHSVSIHVQSPNLFVPITVFLYSPFFFIWLSHSHFILYNTFSKFLYSRVLVQLAMFLLVTSLLIFNHLLLQFFLCIFVLPFSSMTNECFLPLYLQDAFSFPLLSHSHLFSISCPSFTFTVQQCI